MKNHILNIIKQIPVYGWPLESTKEDYLKAIDAYTGAIPQECTRGVLQIGGMSHPGISDIDLIVVLKSGFKSSIKKFKSDIVDSDHRYLLMHDPWFVDEIVLKKFSLLIPFFSCAPVIGDAILPDNTLFPELKKEIALLHLSESLLTKIPRDLIFHLIFSRRLHARFALVLASSVRHSVNLFVEVSGNTWPEADRFTARIDELRTGAINGVRNDDDLREIVVDSVVLAFEMVDRTQGLWEKMLGRQSMMDTQYSGYYGTRIYSNWDKKSAMKWSSTPLGRLNRSIMLPSWAAWHLSLLASASCQFSRHIKSHSSRLPELDAPSKLINAAREMSLAKSEYISFGLDNLNYAGSLSITHGCGEGILRTKARSLMKIYRAVIRNG